MNQHFDWSWLPLSLRKGISLPKIIYEESIGQNYGGYFTRGIREIHIVENEKLTASTIAHEFCHYLQYFDNRIIDLKNAGSSIWNMKKNESYEDSITRFFNTNPCEMEALLFEYKYAKSWLNEWWYKQLILEHNRVFCQVHC